MSNIMSGELNEILAGLGIFDDIEWVEVENFAKYVYPGLEIVMPADSLEGCRENFRRAFPSGGKAIDRIFSDIARLQRGLSPAGGSGRSFGDVISFVRTLPMLISLSRKSFFDYVNKYTDDERLITVLSSLWGYAGLPSRHIPALMLLMMSGECYGNPVSFPRDGYQTVSDFLAKKLLDFGGEIRYSARVSGILMEKGTAAGVEMSDGEKIYGRAVVSNADTKKTFLELVGRQHLPRKFASRVDAHTPSASGISLHLATDLDLSRFDLKYGSIFYYESWEDANIFFDKAVSNELNLESDNVVIGLQAPSLLSEKLAPEGKHILHILLMPVSPAYDHNFRIVDGKRGDEYRALKEKLADVLIRKVEGLIPGLSNSILAKELSTPYTFERYTGATGGAWYDGVSSIKQKFSRPSTGTPIKNLYLTGTKACGGAGMSSALRGGIDTWKAVSEK